MSETWLSQSIEDLYSLPGYSTFFCSRKSGVGGGSALYIADHLYPEQLSCPIFTTAEVVCAKIRIDNTNIVLCQVYRSPNTDKFIFNNELEQCLIWLSKMNKTTLITGDFNFDLFSMDTSTSIKTFFTTLLSHAFFPTISRTTRLSHPSSSLLDNIFCNDLSKVIHSGIILSDLSDHFPVFCSLTFNMNLSDTCNNTVGEQQVFNYRLIEEFNEFLIKKLENIEKDTCPDSIANKIVNAYNEGISLFSYNKCSSRKNTPRRPWVTPAILHSIHHKSELFKVKTNCPTSYNVAQYNRYRNILTAVLRSAKKMHYQSEFAKNSGNSKETWKTLKSLIKSKQKTNVFPNKLIGAKGELLTDDIDIAETFNSFFTEIGENLCKNIPKSSLDPLQFVPCIDNDMNLELTNEEEIIAVIKGLKNVGAGADNISAKLFKLSYQSILKPILHLFNVCLGCGIFPSIFKIAVVNPIFKSGDEKLLNNYRPISILPFMSKILEKLILHRLIAHLDQNNIIHKNQFGFQKNKATYMPILLFQDIISKVFEEGEFALGLFLDLQKAFDTVNIDLLLHKLSKYGVRHTSHKMLSSYLTGRTQCVKVRDKCSNYRNVTMGVPQGSILGPILFIVYINDLPNLSSDMTCLSYADDTAIIFKNKSSTQLQLTVNEHLSCISDWFRANFLSLNVMKTCTQHYTTRSSEFKLDVVIDNMPVREIETVKYLGVFIDKSLKFSHHVHYLSSIISRNVGIIARMRYCLDKRTTHLLYNGLILPYLNYCCLIWGVNYASQLTKLLILQKRAVRLIEHVYPPHSSEPIFKKYSILKLADIAKSQMLLVMHKFVTNQLPPAFGKIYELNTDNSPHRRQLRHIKQPFSNRNYRLFTTSCLGPKLWNDIIAPQFSCLQDIPTTKSTIKKLIHKHFINSYSS